MKSAGVDAGIDFDRSLCELPGPPSIFRLHSAATLSNKRRQLLDSRNIRERELSIEAWNFAAIKPGTP